MILFSLSQLTRSSSIQSRAQLELFLIKKFIASKSENFRNSKSPSKSKSKSTDVD